MATLDEVRGELDKDEPDYPALAIELGEEVLPHLDVLVAEDEPRIASKAAYLAAVIATRRSTIPARSRLRARISKSVDAT